MNKIGVYGMGVMGRSLAHNIARKGYSLSIFNIDEEGIDLFNKDKQDNENVSSFLNAQEFVDSLEKPRKIIIMVTAGKVVDIVIDQLKDILDNGDILIDCGNSNYKDTISRTDKLNDLGIGFLGVGVSGGEKGALYGPSMMPSGKLEDYNEVKQIFEDISAKAHDGKACCDYIGQKGTGHFVKMVHNGIEYGDIEVICEAYQYMKEVGKLSNSQIKDVFVKWNEGRLHSYLIEITANILDKKDDLTNNDLIDMILDVAGQKGTGKWTCIESLNEGVALPSIAESVYVRFMASHKKDRVNISKEFNKQLLSIKLNDNWLDDLEKAVYAAKICCYAQGFELLKETSQKYDWNLKYGNIAMLWREGCIIRANFLENIYEAYNSCSEVKNLIMYQYFKKALEDSEVSLRKVCINLISSGLYSPVLITSLNYLDGLRSEKLPTNLLSAQRDYFGAHTYKRIDKDYNENFHTEWE